MQSCASSLPATAASWPQQCQERSGARREAPAPADPQKERGEKKRKEERAARGTHATENRTAQTEQEANKTKAKNKNLTTKYRKTTAAQTTNRQKTKHRMTAKFFGSRFCLTRLMKSNTRQNVKNRNSGYGKHAPTRTRKPTKSQEARNQKFSKRESLDVSTIRTSP